MNEIKDEGIHNFRCRSTYSTTTLLTNASIITSVYPSIHGIIGDNFYDRELK